MGQANFLISLIILIASTVGAFLYSRLNKKNTQIKPIYILIGGAFVAIFSVMLYVDNRPDLHGVSSRYPLTLLHTIQVMLAGYESASLYEMLTVKSTEAATQYFYLSLLFAIAPVYTFGFVLSFFESISAYLTVIFKWWAKVFVFSELSEKSLTLAKSVRQKFPGAIIAFTGDTFGTEEKIHEMTDEAKNIKALFFKKDISKFVYKVSRINRAITFFTINQNESLNVESSLSIIEKFRNRPNTDLFVFSTSKDGELLLDSIDDGLMRVRRINEARALAHSVIYNCPITDNATEVDGHKRISAMVVGFGKYGSEFTKAYLWCGQLPGYDLEINVIDGDDNTEARFRAECPEIMELNNNTEPGEARYSLNFYNGVDVHTDKLSKIVSELTNTSVVYVALGNDELNIETAINLRILFERIGIYPVIRAIVYSDVKYKTLKSRGLTNHCNESYDIEIIGNIGTRYSYDTIVNEELEDIALECHLRWENTPKAKKQFNEYEYYRNSSIATAIHEKYRAAEKMDEDTAVIIEHMRWNAYMRTEGFVFSGSVDKSSRNDRARMHHNLHRFGLLTDEDVAKDRRIAYKSE